MLARRPQGETATDSIAMPETQDLAVSLAGVDTAFATSASTTSAEGTSTERQQAVAGGKACKDWVLKGHLTTRAMMGPADDEGQVCHKVDATKHGQTSSRVFEQWQMLCGRRAVSTQCHARAFTLAARSCG